MRKKVGYEDMTTMENMTLDGVLENLKDRYLADLIYTYTSSILVAINPYKRLPIYTDNFVKAYKGVRLGKLPPHIFAIAETAYNAMIQHERNQSVLVSGESGAGKTESTKLILQFLSARTGRSSGIDKMVLASVPVLEAMGNAKTGRNDNSSRFGKLIKIQFNEDYYIIGSEMEHYLLEKSRLIFQAPGERNFHIFYQMTNGMTAEDKAKYSLREDTYYNYINKSGCMTVDDLDESKELHEFREALALFDISGDLEHQMFCILAAVLHIGNITFKAEGEGSALDSDDAKKELEITAELLGLSAEDLLFAISKKEIKMRNEVITKTLTAEAARNQGDALAKHLYSVLFDWLVTQLNGCTHAESYKQFIGVLDIFGFEVFVKNSLEQFLINFANEKLQQFFNHQIFKLEQVIYEQEKIDWTIIEFKDNQECLDLIEQKRPPGIISILDEESKFPRATDQTFLQKMTDNLSKHPNYEKPRLARDKFIVKHFAVDVDYEVDGWREKNRDELPEHMLRVLGSSKNMFVAILYSPEELPDPKGITGKSPLARRAAKKDGGGSPGNTKLDLGARGGATSPRSGAAAAGQAGKKGASKLTLGTQFKNQLQNLMDLLGSTEPYFIRCVKSNPQKIPNNFDDKLIYDQLLYAGMLETIRIRRLGYPIRWTHEDFFKRFRVISPQVKQTRNFKECAEKLAATLDMNMPHGAQVGLTKIFLKQEIANSLEDRRNHALTHIIVKLQQWWKMVSARGHFVEARGAVLAIQPWERMIFRRRDFVRSRKKAKVVQAWWRMIKGKKRLAELREIKRKEEEERRKKEEAERLARIKKVGEEQVRKEEELKRKLAAEQDEEERKKIMALLEGGEEEEEEVDDKKEPEKKKKKKKTKTVKGTSVKVFIDMDASCLMFRYRKHIDDCYKFKPRSKDGAVVHKVGWSGTLSLITSVGGEGSDNHQIDVNLKKLSPKVNTLLFIVTLFTPGTTFSEVEDSYVRLIDTSSKAEYCRYAVESSGKETAKIMCKLYRYGYTAWRLKAIGHPSQGRLYKHMISRVNPFLDAQPPKRTFQITIHKAQIQNVSERRSKKGELNTYCETRFDLSSSKTKIAKKTLEPTWNSVLVVSGCATTIEITLMQKKGFAKSSFLARVVVEIEEGKPCKVAEEWFDFAEEDTAQCTGKVKLSIAEQ